MRVQSLLRKSGSMAVSLINKAAGAANDPFSAPFFPPESAPDPEQLEGWFTAADGRRLPVLKNHRYGLKKCWKIFGPLAALAELQGRGLLDDKIAAFLVHARGHRTLTVPLDEIRAVLAPLLAQHRDLFISTDIPAIGQRLLKPADQEIEAAIARKAAEHGRLLEKLNALGLPAPRPGDPVMEIGYTSGGESLLGFERLGLRAIGIDNFYDDNVSSTGRHHYIAQRAGAKASYLVGDITRETPVTAGSLSLVYSLSVLEHISDLPAAFREMARLVRPGGLMVHRYDPYFHVRGGHSAGVLDSPWAHMRLSPEDVETYIRAQRPHEAEAVIPWIRGALNRRHTFAHVAGALAAAGFSLIKVEKTPVDRAYGFFPERETVHDCLRINPGIAPDDLLASAVTIVARKAEDNRA